VSVGAEADAKPLVRLPACHYSERNSGLTCSIVALRSGLRLAYNETPVVIAQNILISAFTTPNMKDVRSLSEESKKTREEACFPRTNQGRRGGR
jgi:hypothetical protein